MQFEQYKLLLKQLSAILDGEHDMIANMANASALLFHSLSDINWAGFYIYKDNELVLGPFQGNVACMHIPIGKGVCGTCAKQRQTICVEDVHAFPGHIACDSASRSELVIPILKENTLLGVLDIDSPITSRFQPHDITYLEAFANIIIQSL